jgi:hypothetical protein
MTGGLMKSRFSRQDVRKLLTGLKNTENIYPPDMISSRRDRIINLIDTTISPRIKHTAFPPHNLSSPSLEIPNTGGEEVAETPISTATVTDGAPTQPVTSGDNKDGDDGNEQVNATPLPKDSPGSHYGNTPSPEHTKDTSPGNNNKNKKK